MAPVPTDTHSTASRATLSAIYTDLSTSIPSHHQLSYPISAPIPDRKSTCIDDKKNYLSKLRDSVKTLQDQINILLTGKMEEDKLHAGTDKDGLPVKMAREKTTDGLEEENYGEESVEDVDEA
jgi:Gon7 family